MKLVVSDEPMDIVLLARAAEHKLRTDVIGQLIRDGHVRVVEDNDVNVIRLSIEGEIFGDRREEFPSTGLIARVQLAIAAGLTERNVPRPPIEQLDIAYRYASSPDGPTPPVRRGDQWSEAMELGFGNTAKITATVNRRDKQRGLRP